MKFKLGKLLKKVRLGLAVGRIVAGGSSKHAKVFDRIENGADIADKAKEIADMVKEIAQK